MELNKNEMDLTSGNLFKKLIVFTFPLMLTGLLQLLYNACDLIVCGKFGSINSVAGISATNSLINLMINLFIGMSVGANILMARYFGSRQKEKATKLVSTSMIFSLIIGVVIGLIGFVFSRNFLSLMRTPDDVIDLSTRYLKIYFLGLPFSMIYNFGSSLLRATGDTKRPFYFLVIAGVINVLLNLLLVIVFKLDVSGVAISTITSQFITSICIIICLVKNSGYAHLDIKKIKLYKEQALNIIRVGLPAGIQGTIFSLSNVLIQSSINSLGTDVLNGNGASSSLEGFIYTVMNSCAVATVAIVSSNIGANKFNNIKKAIINGIILVLIFWAIISGIVLIFRQQLIGIYLKGDNSLAVSAGLKRLVIIGLTYFLCGIMDVLAYSLRGLGYASVPTIVSLMGACGFRIFWILTIFKKESFHNIQGLAISYPISWIITSLVLLICLIICYKRVIKKYTNKNSDLGFNMI